MNLKYCVPLPNTPLSPILVLNIKHAFNHVPSVRHTADVIEASISLPSQKEPTLEQILITSSWGEPLHACLLLHACPITLLTTYYTGQGDTLLTKQTQTKNPLREMPFSPSLTQPVLFQFEKVLLARSLTVIINNKVIC